MPKNYIIADWLVHGGHQYEFFKTGHTFYCTNPDGSKPDSTSLGRPISKNVTYLKDIQLKEKKINIIMIRAGQIGGHLYKRLRSKYVYSTPVGIAVMQTFLPYPVPPWTKCIVWNSKHCMEKHRVDFPVQKHFYIPHGFDPNEFKILNLKRNGKMLAAGSLFKERKKVLGYNEWRWVADQLKGKSRLIGHGNEAEPESIGSFELKNLVKIYNKYSVFLNTTTHSAMPRTRAEAMMCGMPLVSTINYGVESYLVDGKNCIAANTKEEMLAGVKKILSSSSMQEDLSAASRETAIKYFHINDYLARWENVFEEALR